jgi:hypothetical protein
MAKLLSGRLQRLNVGISSYSENLTTLSVVGISSFSSVVLNGSVSVGGTTGAEGQYLVSTGIGVTWESLPTLRNSFTTISIEDQDTFIVNYNVGFIDIFINGVRLTESEYTASNGTSIVLNESCFGGETVDILTYNTSSTGIAPNMISAPETSSSAGIPGQTAYDSLYFYVCVSPNTWKRITLDEW